MNRIAALLAALLLGLAMPALASAQFGPQNVPAPLTQPDDEESLPLEEDSGLSTWQLVLIFGAAIGVIAVVAYVIVRDARGAAGGSSRGGGAAKPDAGSSSAKQTKSARERERERARKRNKAKAARNQRKRNRPR